MTQVTESQLARVKQDWDMWTKEDIKVELCNDTIYGFCSEIASLRLLKKYRECSKAKSFYASNRETYVFALEI